MGEIAEMMLTGILCENCGVALDCDDCENIGVPAYCSVRCAKESGASKQQVCHHK